VAGGGRRNVKVAGKAAQKRALLPATLHSGPLGRRSPQVFEMSLFGRFSISGLNASGVPDDVWMPGYFPSTK
jgi:hypothetical protein